MERLIAAVLNAAGLDQAGIDLVFEFRDDDEIIHGGGYALRSIAVCLDQTRDASAVLDVQRLNAPQALIALDGVSALWQHTHLRRASHGLTGKLYSLRLVPLEDEAEATSLCQRSDLLLEVCRELGVRAPKLAQKIRKS
ncbi:hypothetical protein [Microbacterium sp. NPDC076895]|uniref:hypothetical protein n=1 Tax=Microbacterium sp. NPDC076895 TaxID=3154957 RepID=UPI003417EA2B